MSPTKPLETKQNTAEVKPWGIVYSIFGRMGDGSLTMAAAQQELRKAVYSLSSEEYAEWKKVGVDFARRLVQIAEALQEEIVVLSVRL